MRAVVGLGNPGLEFETTRHNVGFMVVEELAARWYVPLDRISRELHFGIGSVVGIPTVLIEPQGFMNRSGEALVDLRGSGLAESMIVVYDDMDLPAGRLRIRRDGGAGGHRGVESVIRYWGRGFDRVRIGVGKPPSGEDAAFHVLQKLPPEPYAELSRSVDRAADAVECLLGCGIDRAMDLYNSQFSAD